jgi:hypothetical protein
MDSPHRLDPEWRIGQGFCVTAPETPYQSSHDACMYVDLLLALVLWSVHRTWHTVPGMESANTLYQAAIPSIVIHGLAHGSIAYFLRRMVAVDGISSPPANTPSSSSSSLEMGLHGLDTLAWPYQVTWHVGLAWFWWTMIQASLYNCSRHTALWMTCILWIVHSWVVPADGNFTFVQTTLMVISSVNQLCLSHCKKGMAYAMFPWISSLPLTCMGWMESLYCNAFVKEHLYGHVAYDAFIPLSILMWYVACYVHSTSSSIPLLSFKVKSL